MIVQRKLIVNAERVTQKELLKDLKAHFFIKKAENSKIVGAETISRNALVNMLRIFGQQIFMNKQAINSILLYTLNNIS